MGKTIKIGTRGSKLALWQASWVKSVLTSLHHSLSFEIVIIKTKGDKILDVPLAKVGGKGLFVKEIEDALLNSHIDLAVHSMKDMPAEIPDGLCIGAIPKRETSLDVLISKDGLLLTKLKPHARIGTSSLRRAAQLLHVRPDLVILPLRGNIDTRLGKLETENLDAIILAAAGIKRLGCENRITEYLDENIMLPAAGQGALCVEIRQDDPEVGPIVVALEHQQTKAIVMGERAFLNRLEGGCQVPIAAYAELKDSKIVISGLVGSLDGKTLIKASLEGKPEEAESLGLKVAEDLLSKGAKEILDEVYGK